MVAKTDKSEIYKKLKRLDLKSNEKGIDIHTMNIFVLPCSPRKDGNSDTLCRAFSKGAAEAGHRVEIVYPRDKALSYCKKKCDNICPSSECVIDDDFKEIAKKLSAADVIVMATPIYYNKPSKNFKMILDRTKILANDSFANKDIILIITAGMAGEAPAAQTIELVNNWCKEFKNISLKHIIYGTGLNKIDDAKGSEQETQAYLLGKSI